MPSLSADEAWLATLSLSFALGAFFATVALFISRFRLERARDDADDNETSSSSSSSSSSSLSSSWPPTTLRVCLASFVEPQAVCVPLALVMSLALSASIDEHWSSVLRTHCGVWQFLPSWSALTGNHFPQRLFFRLGVALYIQGKLFINAINYLLLRWRVENDREHERRREKCCSHEREAERRSVLRYARVGVVVNCIEDLSLLMLTLVASSENYAIHERSFIVFLVAAILGFFFALRARSLALALDTARYRTPEQSPALARYRRCHSLRLALASGMCASLCVAAYLFWRHNTFCEPGCYSLFALSEYTTVCFNVLYHGVAYVEWAQIDVVFDDKEVRKESSKQK